MNYRVPLDLREIHADFYNANHVPRSTAYIKCLPEMQEKELLEMLLTWFGMLWVGNPFILGVKILYEDTNNNGYIGSGTAALRFATTALAVRASSRAPPRHSAHAPAVDGVTQRDRTRRPCERHRVRGVRAERGVRCARGIRQASACTDLRVPLPRRVAPGVAHSTPPQSLRARRVHVTRGECSNVKRKRGGHPQQSHTGHTTRVYTTHS